MSPISVSDALLHEGAAQSLVEGYCNDPFAVLGQHKVAKQWRVLVNLPGADRVDVLLRDGEQSLQPVAGYPGLFVGFFARKRKYTLRAIWGEHSWDFEDPYRFSPYIGEMDEYLLSEGTHRRIWHKLGAHVVEHEGVAGTHFAVWAPNAQRVSVVGNFNTWDGRRHIMRSRGASGIWEIFIPGIGDGEVYKYEIRGHYGDIQPLKADPVGFGSEHPPATGSVVRAMPAHQWQDQDWMAQRAKAHQVDQPISIYEVHLGSWKRVVEEGMRPLSYTELATQLVDYVEEMGFTHIELMPISEYPFDGSWGYQPVGLFAPTIRYGRPDEFKALVEAAHQRGIGVLLDWVPGHFPADAHGLHRFDGTALYEHADPREGFHQDWNTLIYNYGRREVANYLISNALYWLEEYHIDGLRVDAVASMLYRDYSREDDQWIPNKDGGRENYEAIWLLEQMNIIAYGEQPGIMNVAEESTSYPGVSRAVHHGGLGFGYKWNMGWMNDTLRYIEKDPIYRQHHHHEMTFGLHYAYSENFILPISHDEVVHGKGSMLHKMPGNEWEQFANLRAYYGFMWTHPGKKLLFMGCEFAQREEWRHAYSLDWHLLENPQHAGIQRLVKDLNQLYRDTPALHAQDTQPEGFAWIEAMDAAQSLYAYARMSEEQTAVVVANFTPMERSAYRLGLPHEGMWEEVLNTDASLYGGGDRGNLGQVQAEHKSWQGQPYSAAITVPPLSVVVFARSR